MGIEGLTRTLGVELEVNTCGQEIATRLYNRGVTLDSNVHAYHCRCGVCVDARRSGKWRPQHDSSLSSGVELVSPAMTFETFMNSQHLHDIEEVLVTSNAQVNNRCGGHVHVGVEDYTDSRYSRLYDNWCTVEPFMFYMAVGGQKEHRGNSYSYPLSVDSRGQGLCGVPASNVKTQRIRNSYGHGAALAFNTSTGRTVEYRVWNGTRSRWRVLLNLATSLVFTEAAKRQYRIGASPKEFRQMDRETQAATLFEHLLRVDEFKEFGEGQYKQWFNAQVFNQPFELPAVSWVVTPDPAGGVHVGIAEKRPGLCATSTHEKTVGIHWNWEVDTPGLPELSHYDDEYTDQDPESDEDDYEPDSSY